MRNKLKTLAREIALTALASISGSIAMNANESLPVPGDFDFENNSLDSKKPILLLKRPALDYNRFVENPNSHRSHRSHRSHSSHRSHYSSSSGSSRSQSSSPSRSNSGSSTSGSSQRLYSPPSTEPASTSYSLGDRVLKEGMTGADVLELKTKLNEKGYYSEIGGFSTYFNSQTTEALKKFQEAYGLKSDGVAGQSTFFYLKNDLPKPVSNQTGLGNNQILSPDTAKVETSKPAEKEGGKEYHLTQSTSLRESANSQAGVLKRFQAGEKVIVIDSASNDLWWKVRDVKTGKAGWVKRLLLKR